MHETTGSSILQETNSWTKLQEGSVENSSCQEADPDEHEQAIQPWHNQGANTRRRLPLSYSQFTVQMCTIHCLVCETNLTSRQSVQHTETVNTATTTLKHNFTLLLTQPRAIVKHVCTACTGGALVSFVCFHVDQAENQVNRWPLLKQYTRSYHYLLCVVCS